MRFIKTVLRRVLTVLFRIEVNGLENYDRAGEPLLVVANHTSFLDALLLAVFLPDDLTFAIDTHIAKKPWVKPFITFVRVFPMNPTNPLSVKALIRYLRDGNRAVIFPEGRITVTGSLMKIYDGTGLVADRAKAQVLPVRIDGAQYTPFSRLRGRVRLRWFPQIRLSVLPARRIDPPDHIKGRERRKHAGQALSDLMTQMMFQTSQYRKSLFEALLDARQIHGSSHVVLEDIQREPLRYKDLIARSLIIGKSLAKLSARREAVGLLMPGMTSTVVVMMGLQAYGRVTAFLNFTLGAKGVLSACDTACIKTVLTSRRFVELAKLTPLVDALSEHTRIVYLEDLAEEITAFEKVRGVVFGACARLWCFSHPNIHPDDAAVVLFTSGSEGAPKAVVLSHANLLANREQIASRVDFSSNDIILNALPLFHSFGLTGGMLLPVLSGMRAFLYPSPLHYRIVPEMAYGINATIMFGTNTFLTGYARYAHPYDFYSVRYVFAGAEKLQDETRRVWASKFGVRVFEGYGATETAPALAINTPMDNREGTVGRFLPGIDHILEPVPGVDEGGRLFVSGPNVMLGYFLESDPGVLVPPSAAPGAGWYDTGDIVSVDDAGFIRILGRAKRFAKIGGEMVSLAAVEALAAELWPDAQHAVITRPDPRKGEQLVLVTSCAQAQRAALSSYAKSQGVGEINVPRTVHIAKTLPVLGTGKIDYNAVTELLESDALS